MEKAPTILFCRCLFERNIEYAIVWNTIIRYRISALFEQNPVRGCASKKFTWCRSSMGPHPSTVTNNYSSFVIIFNFSTMIADLLQREGNACGTKIELRAEWSDSPNIHIQLCPNAGESVSRSLCAGVCPFPPAGSPGRRCWKPMWGEVGGAEGGVTGN